MCCAGFIADTGIASQGDAIKEKQEGQSLKAKTRERVQPKMGKIDIDYQKLHDAFFKFQTKPKMTEYGELCVVLSLESPRAPLMCSFAGITKARSLRQS